MGFGGAGRNSDFARRKDLYWQANRNADSISVFQIRENGWLRLVHNEIVPLWVSAGFSVYTRWKMGHCRIADNRSSGSLQIQ